MVDPCSRCEDDIEQKKVDIPLEKRKKIMNKINNIPNIQQTTQETDLDNILNNLKKKNRPLL